MAAISNLTATAQVAADPVASLLDASAFSLVMAGITPGQGNTPVSKSDDPADTRGKRKGKADATDATNVTDDAVVTGDPTATGRSLLAVDPVQSHEAPVPQPAPTTNIATSAHLAPVAEKDGRSAVASTAEAVRDTTKLTDAQIRVLAPALQFLAESQDKKAAATVPVSGDVNATTGTPPQADPDRAKSVAPDPKLVAEQVAALPTTSAMLAARGPVTQSGTRHDAKDKDRNTDDGKSTSDDKSIDAAPDLSVQSASPRHDAMSNEPTAVPDQAGQVLTAGGADRQIDLAKGNAWLDGLSRDIAATSDPGGTLRFQVAPSQLGAIAVELKRGDDGTSITLTASSQTAHSILSDAKPQLVAQAQANGISIADAQVDLGGQSAGQNNQQLHAGTNQHRTATSPDQSSGGELFSQSGGGESGQRPQTRSQPLPEYGSVATPSGGTVSADPAGADRDPDGLYA